MAANLPSVWDQQRHLGRRESAALISSGPCVSASSRIGQSLAVLLLDQVAEAVFPPALSNKPGTRKKGGTLGRRHCGK